MYSPVSALEYILKETRHSPAVGVVNTPAMGGGQQGNMETIQTINLNIILCVLINTYVILTSTDVKRSPREGGIVHQQGVVGDDGVVCAPTTLVATPGPPGGEVQLVRLWHLSVAAGAHVAEDDLPDLLLLDVVVAGDEVS